MARSSTKEATHHVHLILPQKLWDKLGKRAAWRSKFSDKKVSRTELLIEGAEMLLLQDNKEKKA